MRVSVAICTWNRARSLDRTLDGLRGLSIPAGLDWEVLVVNNACTDDTDEVILRHADALPVRRLFEPVPGLSRARNRAVREASGDLIAWTDDDVLVSHGWLAAYARAAADWPSASYFGGPIEPEFEVDPPTWISRNLARLGDPYALCRLGAGTRVLAPGEVVLGANMAARAAASREAAFDVRFGMLRGEKVGGEDVEFQGRLARSGRFGVWVGPARVRHVIPPERASLAFLRRCFRGYGRTKARLEGKPACPTLLGYPRFAVRHYLAARLELARRPAGDPRWADAVATSAFLEGYLPEVRAQAHPKPAPAQAPHRPRALNRAGSAPATTTTNTNTTA